MPENIDSQKKLYKFYNLNLQNKINQDLIPGYDKNDPIQEQYQAVINYVRGLNIKCHDFEGAQGPVAEIDYDNKIVEAAKKHSKDMLQSGKFSHYGSDGSNPFERMAREGYRNGRSENIYYEYNSAHLSSDVWIHAIEEWVNSTTGHCSNIFDSEATHFGMYNATDGNTAYITLDFGM